MSFVVKLKTSLGLPIVLAYTSTVAMDADRLLEGVCPLTDREMRCWDTAMRRTKQLAERAGSAVSQVVDLAE